MGSQSVAPSSSVHGEGGLLVGSGREDHEENAVTTHGAKGDREWCARALDEGTDSLPLQRSFPIHGAAVPSVGEVVLHGWCRSAPRREWPRPSRGGRVHRVRGGSSPWKGCGCSMDGEPAPHAKECGHSKDGEPPPHAKGERTARTGSHLPYCAGNPPSTWSASSACVPARACVAPTSAARRTSFTPGMAR